MGATPEGNTKKRIKKVLDEAGAYFFMPVQSGFGAASLDFLCARPSDGRAFAIEAKAHGKHPSERQQVTMERMTKAGWRIFVIDDESDGLELNYESCAELRAWLNGEAG